MVWVLSSCLCLNPPGTMEVDGILFVQCKKKKDLDKGEQAHEIRSEKLHGVTGEKKHVCNLGELAL